MQRINAHQFVSSDPPEAIFQASWQILSQHGLKNPIIDAQKGVVTATTRANLGSYGETVTVQVEARAEGHLVSVFCVPNMGGTVDFGAAKRKAAGFSGQIEALLSSGFQSAPLPAPQAGDFSAPIASPFGSPAPSNPYGGPIYGVAPPIMRGAGVLTYGIFGLICCPIAAPFALFYGIKALKDYGSTDPGDKTQVLVGTVLGGLGMLNLGLQIFRWGSFGVGMGF